MSDSQKSFLQPRKNVSPLPVHHPNPATHSKEKEVKKLVPSKLNIESIMQEETTIKAQQYVPPALPAVDMTSIAASIR